MNILILFIGLAVLLIIGMSFFIKDISKAQSDYVEKVKKVVVGSRWESNAHLESDCNEFPKQIVEVVNISYSSEGNEFVEYKYGEMREDGIVEFEQIFETIQLEFFIDSFTEI